jgi:hypothetical protein
VSAVVAIVLVIVIGQVGDLIPTMEGPALWAVIVGVGILIVFATGIERGRAELLRRSLRSTGCWPAGNGASPGSLRQRRGREEEVSTVPENVVRSHAPIPELRATPTTGPSSALRPTHPS